MKPSVIGIAHNAPNAAAQDSLDVMVQVAAVEASLAELGISSIRLPLTRDLAGFLGRLQDARVDGIVNLCENVDEDARLAGHPAAVFELMGIPFSGSPAQALMLTTDKALSKNLLRAAGVRTPSAVVYEGNTRDDFFPSDLRYPVIVKPRFEDASIGIDQESIFTDAARLKKGMGGVYLKYGPLIVEEYIAGREFNISVLGYPHPAVLPPAEIEFSAFPRHLYPIVGYRAKWDQASFEYHHTPRVFPEDLDPLLKDRLETTALSSFRLFGLRDYGRVDVRVDAEGAVWVLEINANPCISPDAGVAAAVAQAGMLYTRFVEILVQSIQQRSTLYEHQAAGGAR